MAPLTPRFADPSRQLARVAAIALAVTSALYLGLAVVTVAVLGPRAATLVPLADLLRLAIGQAGTIAAAVAAVVLTLGAVNAYVNGAGAMAGQLWRRAGEEGGASIAGRRMTAGRSGEQAATVPTGQRPCSLRRSRRPACR